MASAEVALENLMLAALKAAKQAAEDGNELLLVAYVDVLDVGLSEANDNGIEFSSSELKNLDPYALHDRVKRDNE